MIDEIRAIGRDRTLRAEVLRQAQERFGAERAELVTEEQGLKRELAWHHAELRRWLAEHLGSTPTARRNTSYREFRKKRRNPVPPPASHRFVRPALKLPAPVAEPS
ncbi:MAG TPA: hypothetical protein EYH34_10070, partial [Planctomycetes bacterium]|nr:hypothetical protein [Planctomycetota bacterium]